MIKRLYLIRHGESNGNATGDYSTKAHDNLTPKGESQAEQLAKKLLEINPQTLFCSPLSRAMQTLKPYLAKSKRKAALLPFFSECCWQEDMDRTISDPIKYSNFSMDSSDYNYFNNEIDFKTIPAEDESWGDGYQRIKEAYNWIWSSDFESAAVLTHGCFISVLEAEIFGREPVVRKHIWNCSINCYEYEGTEYKHVLKDNRDHLI